MSNIIPDILLSWREPQIVRRATDSIRDSGYHHGHLIFWAVFIAFFLMGNWLVLWLQGRAVPPLPIAFAFSIVIGMLLVYGFPMLLRNCNSHIRLTNRGVERSIGNEFRFWEYSEIEDWWIQRAEFESQKIDVLCLDVGQSHARNEMGLDAITLGIDGQVDLGRLRQLIEQRVGKPEGGIDEHDA
ncbi:MAG: hypothetical protein AAFP90_17180 [Planctomycetota bacterium]